MKIDELYGHARGIEGFDRYPSDRHLTDAELEGLERGACEWFVNCGDMQRDTDAQIHRRFAHGDGSEARSQLEREAEGWHEMAAEARADWSRCWRARLELEHALEVARALGLVAELEAAQASGADAWPWLLTRLRGGHDPA